MNKLKDGQHIQGHWYRSSSPVLVAPLEGFKFTVVTFQFKQLQIYSSFLKLTNTGKKVNVGMIYFEKKIKQLKDVNVMKVKNYATDITPNSISFSRG